MITEVSISNFKSIKEIKNLKLKPLTLLTGVNSSGKSNIMEAISFFGQASRLQQISDLSPRLNVIYRYGDVKTYPESLKDFVVYKRNPRKKVTLEIGLKPSVSLLDSIKVFLADYTEARKLVFPDDIDTKIESVAYSFSFRFSDSSFSQKTLINGEPVLEVMQRGSGKPIVIYPQKFQGSVILHSLDHVLIEAAFMSKKPRIQLFYPVSEIALQIVRHVRNRAERIYFISGRRGKIDPQFAVVEKGKKIAPSWIGVDGQHLINILSRCFTREPEKFEKIQEWANKFQLPNLRAGYVGEGKLESNFKDSVFNVILNSTLAGLGSRQILAIITQIFWSNSGDVIMIEEPEISLHPENQVLLHELFSEAISQGKQIICSTHSPFFVLALSKIVKKKLLTSDEIAVYEVEKGKDGTDCRTLELNKHGFIVSGIPSFMKVEEDLFRDWSESLEEE